MKEVAIRALLNPYIAGAIILTTALAFAIKDKIKAQEADAKAAESAKKATEDLKTATEDAKSTLDSIVSDIDQYDNLVKALNDCEEGTEEWNEALQNVKDNIWDILQKYPELAKMDNLFNEDGTLNREVIDGYISEKKKNVSSL
jgi:chromosome segregation ATPase